MKYNNHNYGVICTMQRIKGTVWRRYMGRPPKTVVINNPKLIAEWDYSENSILGLNPATLGCNSHKHANWICRVCGYKWTAEIKSRNQGNGCPSCGKALQIQTLNRNLLKKYGSLFDNNPELASEWHPTDNMPITPKDVLVNSGKSYTWLCKKCGYAWKQRVSVRNKGVGCPACSNKTVVKGFNDLATINPWLALEWHPTLNGNLLPDQIIAGSSKKVYWKCRICGNVWQATVDSRNRGTGCKKCFYSQQVSFQEKSVLYFVKQLFPNAIESYRPPWLDPKELDIFIPEFNIGIEYDGAEWHKEPTKDEEKDKLCLSKGVDVIHIREPLCPEAQLKSVIILSSRSTASLEQGIKELIELLQQKTHITMTVPVVNVLDNTVSILEMIQLNTMEKSFAQTYPELAKEWDYERNYPLIPEQFAAVSGKSVYWRCSLGHQWRARIANRKNGNSCPFCAGRKVLVGFNDLASQYPELIKEWHPTMNKLKPTEVTSHSNSQVFWLCEKGHHWKASPNDRVSGRGCPYCTSRKVLRGYNDLASQLPEIASEWNHERNDTVTPEEVLVTSTKKVWWHCRVCGYDWSTEIRVRARGNGCPNCSHKAAVRVLNTDTNMVYSSFTAAAKSCGLKSGTTISLCCRGKQETAGGYHWRFFDLDL